MSGHILSLVAQFAELKMFPSYSKIEKQGIDCSGQSNLALSN
jgi:hypothetical protein